jgi:hypothetical protein
MQEIALLTSQEIVCSIELANRIIAKPYNLQSLALLLMLVSTKTFVILNWFLIALSSLRYRGATKRCLSR